MDYTDPPPEGDQPPERPGEEEEGEGGEGVPPREEPRFSPFTIGAVLIAVVIAAIAVLLGLMSNGSEPQPPQSPDPPKPGQGLLTRIDLDDLLRITEPYIPFYKQQLYPFNTTSPQTGNFKPPEKEPSKVELRRKASDSSTGDDTADDTADATSVGPVEPGKRVIGLYPAVGKLILPFGKHCTATLVRWDVIVTADHCLPWGQTNQEVWKSIQFIPAYDAFAADEYGPRPYGVANVKRCVGINPPRKGARDMAVCQLDDFVGPDPDTPPYFDETAWARYGFPADGQSFEDFYRGTVWHSIGYNHKLHEGNSPSHFGGVRVGEGQVFPDQAQPPQNCTLLKAPFFADQGWSGGPVFDEGSDAKPSNLIAIVTACAGPNENQRECDTATVTEMAGGTRMGALIVWGLLEWHPSAGFNESSPIES